MFKLPLLTSALLVSFSLALTSCGGGGTVTPPTPGPVGPVVEPGEQQTQIRPETRVPDAASRAALLSFKKLEGEGRARYELRYQPTPFTQAIVPGNVLVSEPGPGAPYGYLVKVTGVQRDGQTVVVQAEQARLTDAIARGRIDTQQALTPDRVVRQTLEPGVRMATRPLERQASGRMSAQSSDDPLLDWEKTYAYELALNKVFYDFDKDLKTTNDQIGSKGKFHFNLNMEMFLDIDWLDLDFRAKVDVKQGTDLELYARAKYEIKKEYKLAELEFAPLTLPIGPVVVVIVPQIALYLDASGKVQGEVTYSLKQTFSAQAGVEYIDSFKNLSQAPQFTFQHSGIQASGSVEAQVGPRLRASFLLYGVAGLYGEARAYAQFKAQYPAKPLWKLDLCASANVGVEADLFVEEFSYSAEVFKVCKTLAEAPNQAPLVSELTAVRDSLFGNGNSITPLDDVKICAKAEDPDQDPLTLRFTSSDGLNQLADAQGCALYRFKAVGVHTVTATAQDPSGAKGSKTLNVTVTQALKPAPVVTITSPFENEVLTMNGASAVKTLAGGSDLGDCTREKWSSSNAADLMPANNCGTPQATFKSTGARTLTLTATNTEGTIGTASVGIKVNPPSAANLPVKTALSMSPSAVVYNNDLIKVTYTLDDPNNDKVSYALRVFSKASPNLSFSLASGQATNTQGGLTKTTSFRMGDGPFGGCPKGDYVLELKANDGVNPEVVKTLPFKSQCMS